MKQTKPFFSFIIPVYNAEETLEESVKSVLLQPYTQYEIILVDDGSLDRSGKLCDELADTYQNIIKCVHQKNNGSLGARITGLKNAQGEYIIYLDADDIIMPDMLAELYEDVIKHDADMYLYDYLMETVLGTTDKLIKLFNYNCTQVFDDKNNKEVYMAFLNGVLNTMCTTIIRRNVLIDSICYDRTNKICIGEDRLQKLFALLESEKIVYVPRCFYYYRWNSKSQSSGLRQNKVTLNFYNDFRNVWEHERKSYQKLKLNSKEIVKYDVEKLNRTCTLVKDIVLVPVSDISINQKKVFIDMLSKDKLFLELTEKNKLANTRLYIKMIAVLILKTNYQCVCVFIKLCEVLRLIKCFLKKKKD